MASPLISTRLQIRFRHVPRLSAVLTTLLTLAAGFALHANILGAESDAGQKSQAPGPATATWHPMKLISRGVPVYASSGTAQNVNDRDYNKIWRSSGLPAIVSFDLSAVPAANRKALYLVWYNDATYGYDHGGSDGVGYNNVGSYTIEVNTQAGGGSPPSSGWEVVATVVNNTFHSRDHVVPFAGYNWLRLNAGASDGSPQNADVAVKIDVYDASAGVTDGWLIAGDSITAGGMGHTDPGVASDSFTNQVGARTGVFPPQQNAGQGGWNSANLLAHLPGWLPSFNGTYVGIAIGTNDAPSGVDPRTFHDNLAGIVKAVLAAHKIPVVASIPWSREAAHAQNIPGLNAEIEALYKEFPQVIRGPDHYAFFASHPTLISGDGVHPTDAGYAGAREQWANAAVAGVYGRLAPAK